MDDQQRKSSASRIIRKSSFSKTIRKSIVKLKYRLTGKANSGKSGRKHPERSLYAEKAGRAGKTGKRRKSLWANSRFRALVLALIALIIVLFVVLIAVGAFDSKERKEAKQQAAVEAATEAETADVIEETKAPETTTEPETVDPDARTVYFTFTGGPGDATEAIMDKLDEYGVKGTFFVVSDEEHADLIKKISDRGHVVGVYTAAEDPSAVYADMESFENDVNMARQFIYQKTGVLADVYRFPGGSYNASYQLPIEDCRNYLEELELRYYDWNVESGDSLMDPVDAQTIADTVLSNIHAYEFHTNVVLFDNSDGRTTTPDALDLVIPQLKEEGFGFAGLSFTTPEMTFDIY